MNFEVIKKRTEVMVRDPQPGDYFTDMMTPVAKVLEREGSQLKIAKPDRKLLIWDDGHSMTIEEFVKWLSYDSIPGFWVEGWRDSEMAAPR